MFTELNDSDFGPQGTRWAKPGVAHALEKVLMFDFPYKVVNIFRKRPDFLSHLGRYIPAEENLTLKYDTATFFKVRISLLSDYQRLRFSC